MKVDLDKWIKEIEKDIRYLETQVKHSDERGTYHRNCVEEIPLLQSRLDFLVEANKV